MSASADTTLPAEIVVRMSDGGTDWSSLVLGVGSLIVAGLAVVFTYFGVRRTTSEARALERWKWRVEEQKRAYLIVLEAAQRSADHVGKLVGGTSDEWASAAEFSHEQHLAEMFGSREFRRLCNEFSAALIAAVVAAARRAHPESTAFADEAVVGDADVVEAVWTAYRALRAQARADLDELLAA